MINFLPNVNVNKTSNNSATLNKISISNEKTNSDCYISKKNTSSNNICFKGVLFTPQSIAKLERIELITIEKTKLTEFLDYLEENLKHQSDLSGLFITKKTKNRELDLINSIYNSFSAENKNQLLLTMGKMVTENKGRKLIPVIMHGLAQPEIKLDTPESKKLYMDLLEKTYKNQEGINDIKTLLLDAISIIDKLPSLPDDPFYSSGKERAFFEIYWKIDQTKPDNTVLLSALFDKIPTMGREKYNPSVIMTGVNLYLNVKDRPESCCEQVKILYNEIAKKYGFEFEEAEPKIREMMKNRKKTT